MRMSRTTGVRSCFAVTVTGLWIGILSCSGSGLHSTTDAPISATDGAIDGIVEVASASADLPHRGNEASSGVFDAPADQPSNDLPLTTDSEAPDPSTACTSSGGKAVTQTCCLTNLANFPDSCAAGSVRCDCQPAQSATASLCICPDGTCFLPGAGCVGPASTCTMGQNQTCNDDSGASSPMGVCLPSGRCRCNPGATLAASTGKCR